MSQHFFQVKSSHGLVDVMLGWDSPMQWFHMYIGYGIQTDENPLYSNLNEVNPYDVTLEYMQSILDKFDITEIEIREGTDLFNRLSQDRDLDR
jgi:hypothetical protein